MSVIFLDTETTGKNDGLKLDEPVSIAIVDQDGNVLLDTLVKPSPKAEIDLEAAAVHGITEERLVDAPTWIDIYADVFEIFAKADAIWAYNAAFDMRVIQNTLWHWDYSGYALYYEKWRCVMLEYARAWKQPNSHGYRNHKLTVALEQQGLPIQEAHSALSDAQMARSLWECLQSGKTQEWGLEREISLSLVSIEKKRTKKGVPYASFQTRGGQTLNVFDNQFRHLTDKNYPLNAWLMKLTEGTGQPLSTPIQTRVKYDGEYLNIAYVESEWMQS